MDVLAQQNVDRSLAYSIKTNIFCDQDCKELGFDSIELNASFIELNEDNLLRLIRLVKNSGMRPKPELGLSFFGGENAELASSGNSFSPVCVLYRLCAFLFLM